MGLDRMGLPRKRLFEGANAVPNGDFTGGKRLATSRTLLPTADIQHPSERWEPQVI